MTGARFDGGVLRRETAVEAHPDPEIERAHLDVAKRRRDEVRLGKVAPLDGDAALAGARKIVGR
jgi:uncharacterized protein YprB with RNaseH-like and TPR domain